MKKLTRKLILGGAAVLLSAGLAIGPATAEPGGCLKYGAAGAVGGHLANHGVLGAAGGCATGMYVRHRHRKEMRNQQQLQEQGSTAPNASAYTTR